MKWKLILLFSFLTFTSHCQPYGNEWINFNQKYLKIPVSDDGIYTVDYATLQSGLSSIGLSITSIDPRGIQLFGRGVQQNIIVFGEGDGSFDSGDQILFYGEKNDGWLDAQLYANTSDQLNPYYSLFNDTSFYFLTISGGINNSRMKPITNRNFTGKSPVPFVWNEVIFQSPSIYNEGEKDSYGVSSPWYQEGEGWATRLLGINGSYTVNLNTPSPFQGTGAPDATLSINTAGASNANQFPNHGLEIYYGPSSNQVKAVDIEYSGYEMHRHRISIPPSSLSTSMRVLIQQSLSPQPPSYYQAFGFAGIKYPMTPSLAGLNELKFYLPQNVDTSYVNFANASNSISYIFDVNGGFFSSTNQSVSAIQALLPPGPERVCIVANDNHWKPISSLLPVTNSRDGNGTFTDYSLVEQDSAFLIISRQGLESTVQQYVSYKKSQGQNAIYIAYEDLIDQYGYGIPKHPLAINHFIKAIAASWKSTPSGVFLVGKSVKENLTRRSSSIYGINQLPTIGVPPSDNMFFATGTDGDSITPVIPIGRLAAAKTNDVVTYFNKVKDFIAVSQQSSPSIDEMIWKKRGIHIAGGGNVNEQTMFKRYLDSYKTTWEDSAQGGVTHNFDRYQSGAIQSIKFDSIETLINGGVSLLSFFGHGSGGELGVNIGEPSDFSNIGKYPIFISNSCNVGDYHLPTSGSSTLNERWVLAPQRGAIGFIASTSLGYPSVLNAYSSTFYRNLSLNFYGQSLGKAMQESCRDLFAGGSSIKRACLEMNLHGDPTLTLYPNSGVDFAIRKNDVVVPSSISTDIGVLSMSFVIYNLGRAYGTQIPVSIQRIYPNGKDTTFQLIVNGLNFNKEIEVSFFIADRASIGENIFKIHVNQEQVISETYPIENNIVGNIRVNVTSDDIFPLYPYEFSIIPNKEVILEAMTADPFSEEREYIFEIDISDMFNTPMIKRELIRSKGGVVSWNPKLYHAPDSIVYFWRCSPNKSDPTALKWRESSFQIIPNQTGWSQYLFAQNKKNEFNRLINNQVQESLDFLSGNNTISGTNKGRPTIAELANIKWSINGNQQGRVGVCGAASGMLISVIDNHSLESWETRWIDNSVTPSVERNPDKNFGNQNDPSVG